MAALIDTRNASGPTGNSEKKEEMRLASGAPGAWLTPNERAAAIRAPSSEKPPKLEAVAK